tara:strand:+ start:491 stop:655 length:165 start_codon:yes stop_codon:yes gene_type:complete
MQNIPTGLKIILRDVGPLDISAELAKIGKKLNERNVNKKMLSLERKFIALLFIA